MTSNGKGARKGARPFADGFDVTCVVGRVSFGDGTHPSPVHAAFAIIADAGPGEYTFPAEDGGTVRVEYEHESFTREPIDAQAESVEY